ncbi:two-component system chemotaxis sensor kinase CheA [Mobilisporobacter senegalensis]|uniref:Chemotaxis protein CheA n=1 Tax=Mobilisporobacter senegalensis TaxID=1329262 RepID=A0A3N1XMG4_9FIRM|nr:chemotaxis protein CheA [Mobilisporobacter senegalensis]ROR27331.1 two-component system chemotaxis sensor kinase CheA [Mobilisporobacter senegalensis]
MSEEYINEPMLEMFLFESTQLIEQLEQSILDSDKEKCYTKTAINEIFRIMHTIKGSSAMMMFSEISGLAHSIEDLFYYIREENPQNIDCSALSDLILEGIDFIKIELEKIKNKDSADGKATTLIGTIKEFLYGLQQANNYKNIDKTKQKVEESKKQYYISQDKVITTVYKNAFKATIYFEDGCEMENIRAYTIIHNLNDITKEIYHIPEDIIEDEESVDIIKRDGFIVYLKSDLSYEKMFEFFKQTIFLKELELTQLENEDEFKQFLSEEPSEIQKKDYQIPKEQGKIKTNVTQSISQQSIISVNVSKLDKLMDLVGEMVIAEAMVIQNPDLRGLELDNFQKAAVQLSKITSEIQDMVMSVRMVPLSATFHKMNRIVRDMCKKLGKEVELKIIGEETEVDKNIIEHISDPLMHLVRNAIDHGFESVKNRELKGKSKSGTLTLEAKNSGSDVLIIVKDDGKGLNKEQILKKARENDLLYKNAEDMSDREIYNLILLPGFSTKEKVSEFSGRGVGMDVVSKNIETIGGTLSIESALDKGTMITLKIPLTLAIIDGMNIKVGNSTYTIPTISIRESFRPKEKDIIIDPDNNEMIMVRGQCYPILRIHEIYKVDTKVTNFTEGIIIMVEQDDKLLCIFADELIGQQQVVVKALPEYIRNFKKIKGIAGCTLLGDGRISLILDIGGLIDKR